MPPPSESDVARRAPAWGWAALGVLLTALPVRAAVDAVSAGNPEINLWPTRIAGAAAVVAIAWLVIRAVGGTRRTPKREIVTPRTRDAAAWLFIGTAIAFAAIGAVTAVWISRSNVGDAFYFGDTALWSATDPGGFYLGEVILFFQQSAIGQDKHPGLTITFMGAVLARGVWLLATLFGNDELYLDFWVRHRILLSALLAGLSDAMLLACTQPLFLVLRNVMDRSAAFIGCTLYLCSVPVLLYVSRFSPEAWMLYFLLWSIELSFRSIDGAGLRTAASMGTCSALAVLSKWLAGPVVLLNLFALGWSARRVKQPWERLVAYAVSAAIVVAVMPRKVTLMHLLGRLVEQSRPAPSIGAVLALPYEQPFVVHHVVVFVLGALGLVLLMWRSRAGSRMKLGALIATVVAMALPTLRNPLWHYFFGFYWLFPAAAAGGLTLLVPRWLSLRRDAAAVLVGLAVAAVCNAWAYPGIAGTYEHYRADFRRRDALVREQPAWVPAPWEYAVKDFETTRRPSEVFGFFYRKELGAIVQGQRDQEDQAERPAGP